MGWFKGKVGRDVTLFVVFGYLLASCHSPELEANNNPCKDFLVTWEAKLPELEFRECQHVERPPGEELIALYVVKGSDAADVEQFLQREFGMAPLKFLCCGWEPIRVGEEGDFLPGHGSYIDSRSDRFRITMVSPETLLNDRQDWHKIPQFQVKVKQYREI
jgi:hypothetical protein